MDRINLDEAGIAVYRCQLWLDDYLWFASSDISAVSTTEGVIHNYALAYALNRFDRAFVTSEVPTYSADLAAMDIYPTPATAPSIRRTSLTFNAIDTATQQTESPDVRRRITPKIGVRRVVNPTLSSAGTFSFYAFASPNSALPRVIRIGKKRSPAHLDAVRLDRAVAQHREEAFIDHVINPLDTGGEPVRYAVISVPPHLLLTEATMREVWMLRDHQKKANVLVPKRVLEWAGDGAGDAAD